MDEVRVQDRDGILGWAPASYLAGGVTRLQVFVAEAAQRRVRRVEDFRQSGSEGW